MRELLDGNGADAAGESSLKPSEAPRARVIRSLRRMISDGQVSPGDPLPSERSLSKSLGVNRSTVRRAIEVLREQGLVRIRETGDRVVAGELHIATNVLVRRAIVILTPFVTGEHRHQQPGWADRIVGAVRRAVRSAATHCLELNSGAMQRDDLEQLASDNPRGLIVVEPGQVAPVAALMQRLAEAKVPVVAYGDEPEYAAFDRVVSDHATGGYELTNWLIARGRKRILPVGFNQPHLYWARERLEGYSRAMREAGLAPLPVVSLPTLPETLNSQAHFEDNARHVAGYLIEHLLRQNRADAIMAASDGQTYYLAAACRILGLKPNVDVEIVGYDDYWSESPERKYEPTIPLATMDKQNSDAGAMLAQVLMDRIGGKLTLPPTRYMVAPKLLPIPPIAN